VAADSWTGLVLAVVGSSAVGAVVGGYLTTVTRGRLEREEAWRTRVIEAAVSLNDALVAMMVAAGSLDPLCLARGVASSR
jgi:hypothetical protein